MASATSDRYAPPAIHVVLDEDRLEHSMEPSTQSLSRSNYLVPPPMMSLDGNVVDDTSSPTAGPTPPVNNNPFNFQTQVISTGPVKSNIGQRRGHRYKHSSVSTQHQIFQEPPPRPPPVLPASLPIPTIKEAWKSMHKDQRTRLFWCLCHLIVATYIFFKSEGSLAATALSHLVFFDAGSAMVCVVVEVLGNFEVWKRSSVRHPFGLERAEVLTGFAMSVFLLFGGFDLISHNLKHFLEEFGDHEPHHSHAHERVSAGTVDFVAVAAIATSIVSAYGLKNHARIAKVMRVSYLASLPSVLSNPFHFLTICVSLLIAVLPLLSITLYTWLDRLICASISLAMFGLGARLAVAQGLMLLMSYGGHGGSAGVSSVLREIESDSTVTRIEEAQFWQVHYNLCMANLKLCLVRGYDEASLGKTRSRISSLIQNRLGEGYGTGGNMRWEVTLEMTTDATS